MSDPEGDMSQCTYRCVVLPDLPPRLVGRVLGMSQCTYRRVVLPDLIPFIILVLVAVCLNAPTGAWCSLTRGSGRS